MDRWLRYENLRRILPNAIFKLARKGPPPGTAQSRSVTTISYHAQPLTPKCLLPSWTQLHKGPGGKGRAPSSLQLPVVPTRWHPCIREAEIWGFNKRIRTKTLTMKYGMEISERTTGNVRQQKCGTTTTLGPCARH